MSIPFREQRMHAKPSITLRMDQCATILDTLREGWEHSLTTHPIDATWHEVPITECLRDGMRKAIGHSRTPSRRDIWVFPGQESRSSAETLVPDGRTDIPIGFTSVREKLNEHDAHAIIECKRIAEDSARLCRAYVEQGIRRFVGDAKTDSRNPKYAANHAVAFMAGYLLQGTTAGAVKRINGYLGMGERLAPPTIVREDWVRTSVHGRSKPLSDITLHHAFLAIQANPAIIKPPRPAVAPIAMPS